MYDPQTESDAKPWTSNVTLTDGTHVLTTHRARPVCYIEDGVLFIQDYPRMSVYADGVWRNVSYDGPDVPDADATPARKPYDRPDSN